MDRVVNIQPVFVDFDFNEQDYDNQFVVSILLVLIVSMIIVIFLFFWDELLFTCCLVTKTKVKLTTEESKLVEQKKRAIDDLFNFKVVCYQVTDGVLLKTLDGLYLQQEDGSQVKFSDMTVCTNLLETTRSNAATHQT